MKRYFNGLASLASVPAMTWASWVFLAGLGLLALSGSGCTLDNPDPLPVNPNPPGGGGSETETFTLSGQVRDVAGKPLENAQITVWADTFLLNPGFEGLPEPIGRAITDSRGHYTLDSLRKGQYRIYYRGMGNLNGVMDVRLFHEGKDTATVPLHLDLALRDQFLAAGSSLSGNFDTASSSRFARYVQVYGLPRFAHCDARGKWELNGLPAGKHKLRFFTEEPYREPVISDTLILVPGSSQNLPPLFSRTGVKLIRRITPTGLRFEGVARDNPIIFDNELCLNTADLAFVLPAMAKGHLNAKGWIVTKDFNNETDKTLADQIAECRDAQELGRLSGFNAGISPVAGSPSLLQNPGHGRLIDIKPIPSEGVSLILAEAAKATPQKPLLYLAGTTLSTLASAYLLDPTIADRIVVLAMYSESINSADTLANFIVAEKFPFVHWGKGYVHASKVTGDEPNAIPTHALGLFARTKLTGNTRSFGDLPLPLLLLQPGIFKGADAKKLRAAPPLRFDSVPAGENGDFWEITKAQNDFDAMTQAIYDSLKLWNSPERMADSLPGAAFAASQGAKAVKDAATGGLFAQLPDGASAEWALTSPSVTTRITLRIRSTKAGTLSLTVNKGRTLSLTVTANTAWASVQTESMDLPGGSFTLQALATGTTIDIDAMVFD